MALRYRALSGFLAMALLGGCSQTVGLYHKAEGGAIAKQRQPPPGANLPYPNLADVPSLPSASDVNGSALPGSLAASPEALAGLALPEEPPLPAIPGLKSPSEVKPAAPRVPVHSMPEPAARPPGPMVSVAFQPGSALLPYNQRPIMEGLAAQRGAAHIRVCGFGDGSLALGLARARRLAAALTAVGVPAQDINITAFAAGSGGYLQLVY